MKVNCQSCGARYGIADDKVAGRRVKVRCKNCQAVFVVDGTAVGEGASDAAGVTHSVSLPSPELGGGISMPPPDPSDAAWTGPEATAAAASTEDGPRWSVSVAENDERDFSTEELIAAWQRGELGMAPYVWREGMTDWLPPMDVPELRARVAGEAPGGEGPSEPIAAVSETSVPVVEAAPDLRLEPREPEPLASEPAFAPPPAQASSAASAPGPFWPPSGPAVAPAHEPADVGPDLFAHVERAGGEHDLLPSAPGLAPVSPLHKTGQRNETSVLFTLDALKQTAAKPAPRVEEDEPVADLSNLFGSRPSLRSAPEPELGLGQLAAVIARSDVVEAKREESARQPEAPKNRTGLYVAAGVFAAVLVAGAVFFSRSGGAPSTPGVASDGSGTAAPSVGAAVVPATPPRGPEVAEVTEVAAVAVEETLRVPVDEARVPPAPGQGTNAATAKPVVQPAPTEPKPPTRVERETSSAGQKTPLRSPVKPPSESKKPEPPKPVLPEVAAPASSAPPFSAAAAKEALAQAAADAKACKSAGGESGKTTIEVTFAPSGRATSANIVGDTFRGTLVGGCIASKFRRAKVPAFAGEPKSVKVSFSL